MAMASDLASEFSRARLYRSGGHTELAGLAESGPVRLQAQLGSQHWSWKGEARRGRLLDAWCVQGARVRKGARFPSGAVFSIRRAPHVSRCGARGGPAGSYALAWTCPGAERSACVSPRSESAVYSSTRDGTGRPRERPAARPCCWQIKNEHSLVLELTANIF